MTSRLIAVLAAAISAAVALVAVIGLSGLTAASSASGGSSPSQPATPIPSPEPGECIAYGDKVASEQAVLGGTARITLTANVTCTEKVVPLHAVFVLDASEAYDRWFSESAMSSVALAISDCLLAEEYPATEAAVVEFNDEARTTCDTWTVAPIRHRSRSAATASS